MLDRDFIRVSVGSSNPTKLTAVQIEFARILNCPIRVVSEEVDPGVPEQPWDEQIILGAENRCKQAVERHPTFEYHVGIESGVLSGITAKSLVCVEIAVIHGNGMSSMGMSSGFLVPTEVSEQIKMGIPMSQAADSAFGTSNLGQKEGLIGLITDNRLRRNEYIGQAVMLALCALLKRGVGNANLFDPTR